MTIIYTKTKAIIDFLKDKYRKLNKQLAKKTLEQNGASHLLLSLFYAFNKVLNFISQVVFLIIATQASYVGLTKYFSLPSVAQITLPYYALPLLIAVTLTSLVCLFVYNAIKYDDKIHNILNKQNLYENLTDQISDLSDKIKKAKTIIKSHGIEPPCFTAVPVANQEKSLKIHNYSNPKTQRLSLIKKTKDFFYTIVKNINSLLKGLKVNIESIFKFSAACVSLEVYIVKYCKSIYYKTPSLSHNSIYTPLKFIKNRMFYIVQTAGILLLAQNVFFNLFFSSALRKHEYDMNKELSALEKTTDTLQSELAMLEKFRIANCHSSRFTDSSITTSTRKTVRHYKPIPHASKYTSAKKIYHYKTRSEKKLDIFK